MDLGLSGKRAIVTGGTRGIGRAIVDCLLAEGASVVCCARNADEVGAFDSEMSQNGLPATAQVVDVSDHQALLHWQEQAVQQLGGLDIYVPNVSAGPGQGDEGWQAAFQVDLMSSVKGSEHALGYLAQSQGAIVMIATIAAIEAFGGPAPYNSLKAALITYASQLGELAAPHGVRVNCVSPGPIHIDDGFWGQVQDSQPEAYQEVAQKHPLKRLGTAPEVANCVAFLASPAASWVTRTNLVIDGGYTRRIQF